MAARHLFAAAELGIFEALADTPRTLNQLASAVGVPARTLRIVTDALVALGLVVRDNDGRYANCAAAQHYLSGREHADLRPLLRSRSFSRVSRRSGPALRVRSQRRQNSATPGTCST